MPKLAANLSWIYQEVPFLQRFGAAAAHGFKAVEILLPYEAPAAAIAAELKKHKLTQALFNLPPGDWGKGERGIAALPGREAEFAAVPDHRPRADRRQSRPQRARCRRGQPSLPARCARSPGLRRLCRARIQAQDHNRRRPRLGPQVWHPPMTNQNTPAVAFIGLGS